MIDLYPNVTFFIQMGVFLVTLFFLNILIFRPVLRIIAKRHEITEGFREEAQRLETQCQDLITQVEGKMKEARDAGLAVKGQITREGETEAQDILGQAREDLEETLQKHRQEIQAECKEAQLSLRKHSQEISGEMAEKLLGRKVSA
ncbi:MAG: ATP synthase F0 subunit B [bacterium]|nr:ATP synthase F0 subunit B [bacterium]